MFDRDGFAAIGDRAVAQERAYHLDGLAHPRHRLGVLDAVLGLDLDLVAGAEAEHEAAVGEMIDARRGHRDRRGAATKTLLIAVPKRIRVVASAHAVSSENWSPPWPSTIHTDSYPAWSASRAHSTVSAGESPAPGAMPRQSIAALRISILRSRQARPRAIPRRRTCYPCRTGWPRAAPRRNRRPPRAG